MDLFKKLSAVDEYNDLLAEAEQLRAIIKDQQILLDEHGMDNRHSYEEGGNSERAAVMAWLRGMQEATEWSLTAAGYEHAADTIERGEHRRKENE